MIRALPLALCFFFLVPSPADGEEQPERAQSKEQWLKDLRGSGTYRDGLDNVRRFVERGYDLGAIAGASHWEDMNEYYTGVARAKGCQRGQPFADGPVKACHRVEGPEPKLMGQDYKEGMAEAVELANDTLYPDLVKRVLVVLYDYGYVQGVKHGIRADNDDIRLAQSYYRSCMAQANSGKGEAACAEGSKTWASKLLERIHQRVEAHGLPAGSKPSR